jgi:hypothetical protein
MQSAWKSGWREIHNYYSSHSMGKSKLKPAKREEMHLSSAGVQTMAGWVKVRREAESTVMPMGKLACSIEFLNVSAVLH